MSKKVQWTRTLGEVLNRQTETKTFKSKKGKDYETECIPRLDVVAVGAPTQKKDDTGYTYEAYDSKTDASFNIKAPEYIEVKGFKRVAFIDVRGGALQNKPEGWFSASRVVAIKES